MKFSILPRQDKFFKLFKRSSENLKEASGKLVDLMENYENVEAKVTELKRLEEVGDSIIHEIMSDLHKTFITPLDREDISTLGERLDDIMDCIEEAARYMLEYDIKSPTKEAQELSRIIANCCETIDKAMTILGNNKFKELTPLKEKLHVLENEADQVTSKALGELFRTSEAIDIIKWKEVYDQLESATDRAENVAVILDVIVIKHG